MASTRDEIIEIIAKQSPVDREKVVPEAVMEDLEIESLDLVEIIFAIEEKFDITIPYNANDPSTIGRAYSVTVLLGTICQNWGRQSNEVKKKSKGEMVTWALLPDPDTLYRAVKNVKIQFPLRSDQLHMP